MGSVIVVQFITVDGVVEDPDGTKGTPIGGWATRLGPDAIAGDKFDISPLLEHGALLLGHWTWQLFSQRWPARSGDFPDVMNRSTKIVASRRRPDLTAWNNSHVLDLPLSDGVGRLTDAGDVVIIGSTTIVHALADADLVDEYRLLTFPTTAGEGQRLFTRPMDLVLTDVRAVGPMAMTTYRRVRAVLPADAPSSPS